MPDRETQRRSFSVNMELIPVTILNPNGTRNKPLRAITTNKTNKKTRVICQEEPRKPGHALRSRKCALLYRCPTCIYARSARPLPAASECGSAGGSEYAFGVSHRHPPIPPRAAALAPLRGYPMSRNDEERTTKEGNPR